MKDRGADYKSSFAWRAYMMMAAEALVELYQPMEIENFRVDEIDAWDTSSEPYVYWELVTRYGLQNACSFANSLDTCVLLCRGTTGLSVPSNYYKQRVGKAQFRCITDSLCSLRKKQRGQRTTPQAALDAMGSSGTSWSDWKLVVKSGSEYQVYLMSSSC
jgi:hypothetical protein